MSVSERLKRVIESKFATLKSASEFTGIPYRSLQSYISGKQLPGSEALIRLHNSLKIDLNWLLTGDNDSFPTMEDRKEVCVNLIEYIEMEYVDVAGEVPYCGTVATIYNRVLHHKGVTSNPWDNLDALKKAVPYEVRSYIDIADRIKKRLDQNK
ncbi:helix-turn-helix domain-containing protein [Vibrio sp. 10N.247.311.51]|uniref:helix-turn-helix domain-containing protein n=1 Tax=Vibrio sp. 10N.247.311.51 TaxID=3229996 RepID=UPI0035531DDD